MFSGVRARRRRQYPLRMMGKAGLDSAAYDLTRTHRDAYFWAMQAVEVACLWKHGAMGNRRVVSSMPGLHPNRMTN